MSVQGSEDGQVQNQPNKLRWTKQIEKILRDFADTAACYKVLHGESYQKYKTINYVYNIPIIILSTFSGAISVGMSGFVPAEYINLAQLGVGVVNIVNGIVSTLLNFFGYAQLREAHNNAYVGWSRLHRNIKIELNMERKSRKNPNDFVKVIRSEYDRLMEQQPIVPKDIIRKFRTKIKDSSNLVIPDEAGATIQHTIIYEDNDDDYDSDAKDDDKSAKRADAKENWKRVKNTVTKNNIINTMMNAANDTNQTFDLKIDESNKAMEIIKKKSEELLNPVKDVVVNVDQINQKVFDGYQMLRKQSAEQQVVRSRSGSALFPPPPKPIVKEVLPIVKRLPTRVPLPRDDVLEVVRSGGTSVKNLLSKFSFPAPETLITPPTRALVASIASNSKENIVNSFVDETLQQLSSAINEPIVAPEYNLPVDSVIEDTLQGIVEGAVEGVNGIQLDERVEQVENAVMNTVIQGSQDVAQDAVDLKASIQEEFMRELGKRNKENAE
jgi:hypothetical protein